MADLLQVAIDEAKECAIAQKEPHAVVIGYDDFDRLCWLPIPTREICVNDHVEFRTDCPVRGETDNDA